jgi:hypothetical protein
MGKQLLKTDIKREPQMLYYCGTSSEGNITVCCAEMKRGGKAKKKK